jgi:hypothetical protein
MTLFGNEVTFGFGDGTRKKVRCEVMCIADGDSCYQLYKFEDGKHTFILETHRKELFEYVKKL